MPARRSLLALLAAAPLLPGAPSAAAVPEAQPWSRWQAHDPASSARVDHGIWAALLRRLLRPRPDGRRLVAYAEAGAEERAALRAYLDGLAAVPVSSLARPEQMAFWINLHNALALRLVLDHWPVRSIRDIALEPGPSGDGPFTAKLAAIEGEPIALDDILHRILRPIWRDPRIHYASNRATMGCPDLAEEPYEGARLDAQLDAAGFAFVNRPRAVRLEGGRLLVSSIFRWFQADFGGDDRAVVKHLCGYAAPALAMALQDRRRIDGHAFDWSVNAAP